MGVVDGFLDLVGAGARAVMGSGAGQRNFDGAAPSRLVANWHRSNQILDRQLRLGLQALRERSRDLIHNTSYGARFIHLSKVNIVGPHGVQLQVKVLQAGKDKQGNVTQVQDKAAQLKIEDAFERWSNKQFCTVTGKHSFTDVQKLVVAHLKSDGEAVIRKRWGVKGNPFKFALQLIDPALLDEQWERQGTDTENQIRLGVEYDKDDKPVAYWFKKRTLYADIIERTRVPAAEIYHVFDPIRTGQTRGIPPLSAAMLNTKMVDAYTEAEITAARMGAAKMGFLETQTGDEYSGEDDTVEGGRSMDMSPGSIEEVPKGWKFTSFDPQHPTTAFGPFLKVLQRGISAALNVAYHALTGDLEGVNYSSLRAGLVEDRESYKMDQESFKTHFLEPVFADWLEAAIMAGEVALPMAKFDKFNVPNWRPRRWSWVDPLKDIQATMLAIKSGMRSHRSVLLEEGRDLDEVWAELSAEKKQAEALGLELATFAPAPVTMDTSQDKEAANGGSGGPAAQE